MALVTAADMLRVHALLQGGHHIGFCHSVFLCGNPATWALKFSFLEFGKVLVRVPCSPSASSLPPLCSFNDLAEPRESVWATTAWPPTHTLHAGWRG